MGKTRKLTPMKGGKQRTISTFFQRTEPVASNSHPHRLPSVETNGSPQKSAAVGQSVRSGNEESTITLTETINITVSNSSPISTFKGKDTSKSTSGLTSKPETRVLPPDVQAKEVFTRGTPRKNEEDETDVIIIPDTPKSTATSESSRKRIMKSSRSFLCSSSFLAKGHLGPLAKKSKVTKAKKTQQKGRSLEEALKDHWRTGGANSWNSCDTGFNVVMAEMGVHVNNVRTKSSDCTNQEPPKTESVSNNPGDHAAGGATKRSPSRDENVSPISKKPDRRPSGSREFSAKVRRNLTKESDLKSCALKELSRGKKSKGPPGNTVPEKPNVSNEDDDVLGDILSQLTKDVNITGKRSGDVAPAESAVQSLLARKRVNQLDNTKEKIPAVERVGEVVNEVDSRMVLNDLLDELKHAKSSCVRNEKQRRKKRSLSPPKEVDAADHLGSLETSFKSLSPFKIQSEGGAEELAEAEVVASGFNRFSVVSVERGRDQLQLELQPFLSAETTRSAVLRGFWADTIVNEGAIVHVIGAAVSSSGEMVIDNSSGLLVVNPDLLISGTTVVSTVQCMRRSVLNEKFKGYDGKNIYMLYGSIIHTFFQQVLEEKAQTTSAMENIAQKIVQNSRYLHDMYGEGVSEKKVLEEIRSYMPQVLCWGEKYLFHIKNCQRTTLSDDGLEITSVSDIEENIWSPRYGTKGKIDLTVDVRIHTKGKGSCKKSVPLELKTGRPSYSSEHVGQVTLYSMMSGDRRQDPNAGLLLYLKDASMKLVPASHASQRGLIQLRNELAHHLNESVRCHGEPKKEKGENVTGAFGGLPEPINNRRQCSKCPHILNCSLYQRSVEARVKPANSTMETLVLETTSHLQYPHLDYFKHWVRLLHLEMMSEKHRSHETAHIWLKTASEREKTGMCLGEMVLTGEPSQLDNGSVVNHFVRRRRVSRFSALNEVGLSRGDTVVVSAQNKTYIALSQGSIQHISDATVALVLDRDLYKGKEYKDLVFRIDKHESQGTYGINFTNLTRLMEDNSTSANLRSIVIDKKTPEFDETLSKGKVERVRQIFKALNKAQKAAVLRALLSRDYVLIKGYPGTGKTSTIVALVRILVALGKSVLLCSYTHSAVDNILLKLSQKGADFVRLGRLDRIHPDIRRYSAETLTSDFTTVAQLEQFYEGKSIVATTCLGVTGAVFSRRTFDVCVVDEASQVLQPACLGPLFCSRRFVLVGDPKQLPPVIQSRAARKDGMSESLFARLDDTGATFELTVQYRMNRAIMRLCNELVYGEVLQCGSDAIASSRLVLANIAPLEERANWIQEALSCKKGDEVVFLDTEQVIGPNSQHESSCLQCEVEGNLVLQLVRTSTECGVGRDDIGVITPYRQQVKYIKRLFLENHFTEVEVNTVDQYQGRDKLVVIVSFVKSSAVAGGHSSEILNDVRRLNVAVSRARVKLILIGHGSTLVTYEHLSKVLPMAKRVKVS